MDHISCNVILSSLISMFELLFLAGSPARLCPIGGVLRYVG
jgi:hypothetical protein